jgi:CRP/FNR family transcriptional regulator
VNASSLDPERRAALLAGARRSIFARGEPIFTAGDTADGIYFVNEGRVKVVRTHSSGAESIVGIRHPGDVFGEVAWTLGGRLRTTSAIALVAGAVDRIEAEEFDRRVRADSAIAAIFAHGIVARLTAVERELTDLAGKSVAGRLVDILGRLAAEHGLDEPGGGVRLGIDLTHQDLADLIGTSRETLTKELGTLSEVGLLRVSHRTIVLLQPRAFPFARRRERN